MPPVSDERLAELTDRLENGIKELYVSGRYAEYLAAMSKFHRYSYKNALLIVLQCPTATHVAGYKVWKEEFGRQVKRGEHGILIFAPSQRKRAAMVEKKDPSTGQTLYGPDGKPLMEPGFSVATHFVPVYVFDVGQTEGKELPIKNKTTRDAARTEQRQMERESISAMRDSSLTMITSSQEHYMEYLNLQADNIQCSVGNVALTMAQLQGATQIGSTDYWHSQGRYVRDDAINAGAKVFVPPRNKQYRGYFMGNYYDVSQTTGKPLPEQAPLTDQDPRMDMALAALMDQSPVTVAESRDIDAPAYYDPERLTIFINPDCSHTAVFATLAAEIPLARVHDRGYNASFSREYYSLDAKSAGYMVCRRFGVECPTPEMAEHVDRCYNGLPASVRGEMLEGVRSTARNMSNNIEQTINPRQQERGNNRHFRGR